MRSFNARLALLLWVIPVFSSAVSRAATEATLYTFGPSTDGAQPEAPLAVGEGGVLYGTTEYGGAYGYGARRPWASATEPFFL